MDNTRSMPHQQRHPSSPPPAKNSSFCSLSSGHLKIYNDPHLSYFHNRKHRITVSPSACHSFPTAGSFLFSAMSGQGLLRLPHFLRDVMQVVKDQQQFRPETTPSLLNTEIRIQDVYLCVGFALFVILFRIYLEKAVQNVSLFSSFSKRMQCKLAEDLFYCAYYISMFSFYAFVVRPRQGWSVDLLSNDTRMCRELVHPLPPPMVNVEHYYYSLTAGFYMSASAFLIFFDSKRSDFLELIIHHCVTILLVAVSYSHGYVRTGIVIIALHDVGDVFLYLSKFLHHLGMKGYDTAMFALLVVTFYITRLVLFSRMVHMIFIDTLMTIVEDPSFNNWAMYYETYLVQYVFFAILLGTLLVLQCFWFSLMLRMIYKEVILGVKLSDQGDIRSDDESDDGSKVESFTTLDDSDGFLEGKKKQ